MKTAAVLFLTLFLSFGAAAFQNEFYTLTEYMVKYPEQAWRADAFNDIVEGEAKPLAHMNPKPIRIAAVYPGNIASDFWHRSLNATEQRLRELNVNYTLYKYYSSSTGDVRLQVAQLAEVRDKGVDFLLTAADGKQVRNAIGRLLTENKINIIIQNRTAPLKEWSDTPPLLYAGFDLMEGSRMIADKVAELFTDGADYGILHCDTGEIDYQRIKGLTDRLNYYGGFRNRVEYYTGYDSEKAYAATADMLAKHPEIEYIFACSTDIAIGAAAALKASGASDRVCLSGWGGSSAELELMKKGSLDFTVVRLSDDSGVAAAEAIKMVLEGRRSEVPHVFAGGLRIMSADDSAESIDRLKKRIFRYSGVHEQ